MVADTACSGLCGLGFYVLIFPGDSAKHGRSLPRAALYCPGACTAVFLVADSAVKEGRIIIEGAFSESGNALFICT